MSSRATSIRTQPFRALLLIAFAALLLSAPAAGAAQKYRLLGHGYGHGVGLSQWGAYGFANHGTNYKKIVKHYFKSTEMENFRSNKKVRVLLATTSGDITFSGAKRACGFDLHPSSTYQASLSGSKVRLERDDGKRLAGCGSKLIAKGVSGPIKIGGQGSFRGDFVAAVSGGELYAINQVSLDDYVQGVIPNEMPASWPHAALEAQAVAARSYALATDAGGASSTSTATPAARSTVGSRPRPRPPTARSAGRSSRSSPTTAT